MAQHVDVSALLLLHFYLLCEL